MSVATLKQKIASKSARIAVVGFGYIGTSLGATLASSGYPIIGIDINPRLIEEITKGSTSVSEPGLLEIIAEETKKGRISATDDFSVVKDVDIILVTVGTPIDDNYEPDMSQLYASLESLAPHVSKDQLVILKSTVPPLTTEGPAFEKLYKGKHAKEEVLFAFAPERVAQGTVLAEFRSIPIVIGGINPESTELASYFFRKSLEVEIIELSNPTAAEMVKLADNMWIDLNIALANEMAMIADGMNIDALEIIKAANSLPKGQNKVNILLPSVGVGGSCLPKDPWFLHEMGKKMGLDLKIPSNSRLVNDRMPEYSIGLIEKALEAQGKTIEGSNIGVLGIAFKTNTGDCRFTPAKPFLEKLQAKGCNIKIYDPLVSDFEAAKVTDIPLQKDIESTVSDADCVAFLAGHDEFKQLNINALAEMTKKGTLLFDGRMYYTRDEIEAIEAAGFTYVSVGRTSSKN